MKTSFAEVKKSAQGVQNAKAEELEQASNNLDKAIQNIPSTATLQQARASIAPQIAAVESAQAQTRSGVSCP